MKFNTIPKKTLYQSILSTSSTFKMSDIEGFNGSDLAASDFGTLAYGVILNSEKTIMELFSFDPATIASTSISFVYRGLKFDGDLTTEVTANKLDWNSGSTILIGTDSPQVLQWLKEYIDAAVVAQGVPATDAVPGISIEATQAQVDAKTTQENYLGNPYDLFVRPDRIRAAKYHDAIASAIGTDSYAITVVPAITAYATSQEFTFIADVANTGACTLNVCGLGAKTIKKDVSSDLATGDILLGQVVKVIYDGTNMQLISVESGLAKTTDITNAVSPLTTAKQYTIGALDNALIKTYFNIQLPFILWIGAVAGDLTTSFVNWVRTSTDPTPSPGGALCDFTGTGSDGIYCEFFKPLLKHDTSTNIVIMDWWAILPASGSTGDLTMGLPSGAAATGALGDIYARGAIFIQDGTDGKLYASTSNGTNEEHIDVSAYLTQTNWNNFRIEYKIKTSPYAKFYINGVLVATLNTYIDATSQVCAVGFGRSDTSLFQVTAPTVSLQMNP